MGLIKVMVSSTIRDLIGERDAIENVFRQINLVEVIGAQPFDDRSFAGSSRFETVNMAKECDLFIHAKALATDVVLTTFRVVKNNEAGAEKIHSLRSSSIWKFIDGRWQMVFHSWNANYGVLMQC